jgi:hypothetical protein
MSAHKKGKTESNRHTASKNKLEKENREKSIYELVLMESGRKKTLTSFNK